MGLFITFEGIEGCGKTTQARLLAEYLKGRGSDVVFLREPGGTALGERIREILLNTSDEEITPRAELFLYEAARAQIVSRVIAPALEAGKTVVCDRFTDSTVAYQGFARGLPLGDVAAANRAATGGVAPDVTILIDCDPALGIGRAMERIGATSGPREDRFEREGLAFHEKVRQGYLSLAGDEPGRFRVIDGSGTIEEVHRAVVEAVEGLRA